MAYKAGDAADQETGMLGKIVCDGESGEKTYAFTYNVNDKVFFTETPLSGTVKNYGASVASLYGEGAKVQLETTEYAAKEVLIKDFDEAYKISGNKIIKGTMVGNDYAQREVVAIVTDATLLIDIFGEDLYYLSGGGKIMRIKLGDEQANEIVVSDSTALTGWFAPEFVTVGEKSYLFYATDSEADFGYVKFVDVNSEVKEEDDIYSLGDSTLIGIKTEVDKASGVAALIVEASEAVDEDQALKLKKDDSNGTLYSEKLNEAIAAYNNLKEETKALVSEDAMAIFNKLKKAVEMANVYNKLEGMYGYDNKNITEQAAVRAVYDGVKGQLQAFVDSSEYSEVQVLIPNNIKSYYTDALRKFK